MADKDNELEIMEMLDKASRGEKLGNEGVKNVLNKTKSHKLTTSKKALIVTVTVVAGLAILPIPIIIYNKNKNKNIGGQVSIDYNINEAEDVEVKFKKGDTVGSLQAANIPGYRFDGWYGDEGFKHKLSNEMQIADDDDLQIFGRYIEVHKFTMHFVDGLGNIEEKVIEVDDGTTVAEAIQQLGIANNYRNVGHYTSIDYIRTVNIHTTKIEDDYKIYSKYIKSIKLTVYVDGVPKLNGVQIDEEDLVETLAEYENKDRYKFKGWYTDRYLNERFDITKPLTQDTYYLYNKHVQTIQYRIYIDGEYNLIDSDLEEIESDYNAFCEANNISEYTTCGWFNEQFISNNTPSFTGGSSFHTKRATLSKLDFVPYQGNEYTAILKEGAGGEIVIPSKIGNDSVVTRVDGFANSNITSVTLPATVTTIVGGAFENCASLTNINMSETLRTIDGYAFARTGITSITIPEYCKIGEGVFEGCSALEEVNLPNRIDIISKNAFKGCVKLKQVEIVYEHYEKLYITTIEDGAFEGCELLTEFDLSECTRLKKIGVGAFTGCTSLTSVILPEGVWYTTTNSNYIDGEMVDIDTVDVVALLKNETLYWYR